MYTFVIRSEDRVEGTASDFRVKMPFLGQLANCTEFRVGVVRAIFPQSDSYHVWYVDGTGFVTPNTTSHINSEFVELHLDFGTACKGHDTRTGGPRLVHFVSEGFNQRHESGPNDAIYYDIAGTTLTELRVRVIDKRNDEAGAMVLDDYPTFSADATLSPGDLPEWVFVLSVTPTEKYV